MNRRVFVPRESNVADLPGLLGLEHGLLRAALSEDPVRVLQADDLMVLHQIHVIGLQALERFVDLPGGSLFRTAVDLGHEENFLPVPLAQGLAHANLASPVMVVPGVVQDGDAMSDRARDDTNALLLVIGPANGVPALADQRHLVAYTPACPVYVACSA